MAKTVVLEDALVRGGSVVVRGTVDGVDAVVTVPASRFIAAGTRVSRQQIAADALIDQDSAYGVPVLSVISISGTIIR